MATWCQGVRAATHLIHGVEQCLREACVPISEVTLYPWQSYGGRSKGVTALFETREKDTLRRSVAVSLYEHWNTDHIDIQFHEFVPCHMSGEEGHDTPHIQFDTDQVKHAAYAIQSFVVQALGLKFPEEWYVPLNHYFQGFGCVDKDIMEYVDDKMTPVLVKWLPEQEEKSCPCFDGEPCPIHEACEECGTPLDDDGNCCNCG